MLDNWPVISLADGDEVVGALELGASSAELTFIGSKIALSGSHNFMRGSGIMGTREIALETSDPAIIKQLEAFRKKYVE